MKRSFFLAVPLMAALALPAVAQQAPAAPQQQPSATQSSSTQDMNSDQNMSAHQPLQPQTREGFWGKVNPFARKKYVQRQLSPIRDRVNELDDLTAANSRAIKDVDARAQEGIRQAQAKANEADQHAVDAGNRAQQANQTATMASTRLNTVEQVVGNIDQYQPATQTEIRYRAGQTVLSAKAKSALDDMTANLKDQKGYIIEVQGFSAARGQAGVQSSQAMANSVVRYLVEKGDVPVYRIFVMGLGRADMPTADGGKPAHTSRVEVSLMKNNVDQLAMNQSGQTSMSDQSGSYTAPPPNAQPANTQTQSPTTGTSNPPQQ